MLSLNLDLSGRQAAIARRSARAQPWSLEFAREIGSEDLLALSAITKLDPDPKAPLARLHAPHHMMARLVAEGKADAAISAITGYTPARIRTLKADPAFSELVNHYEEQVKAEGADVQAQVQGVALMALHEIRDRLENDPSQFNNKELRELMTSGLDRTGHGPSSKQTVNINDPNGVIEGLRAMMARETRGRVLSRDTIDVSYTELRDEQAETCERLSNSEPETDRTVPRAEIAGPSGGGPEVSASGLESPEPVCQVRDTPEQPVDSIS